MIATILQSTPTFHAVAYNEAKVAKGAATLLEIKNFGEIDNLGYSEPEELTRFLIEYSKQNSRIKNPQFHLAISCKGQEYTHQQLMEFAHQYLKEMGYGDPDQPLLIYGHTDTDNNHIHIITSRVDPRGKKINDSNERRKSQKVLEKILKTNLKEKAEKDVETAMQFDFRNVQQFKSVMEAMNYECFEKNGNIYIKKGGMIQTKIETDIIAEKAEGNKIGYHPDIAEQAKWRQIFRKYRDTNSNRSGLERDLKKTFGVSLVFFGKKDAPFGYAAVDFNKKKVYEGGRILGIKELLDFRTPEEHMHEIEEFINQTFEQNAFMTTKDLNKKLRKFGAYVRKDAIIFGDLRKAMAEGHHAILERNNKIDWRNGFKPQTPEERDLLCKLTGFDYTELISVAASSNGKYYCKDHKELSDIFSIIDTATRAEAFKTAGFRIITEGSGVYAYRAESQTLTELSKAGFERSEYEPLIPQRQQQASRQRTDIQRSKKQEQPSKKKYGTNMPSSNDGSHYANREWEVGKKGYDRDDIDQIGGVSY